VHPPVDDRDVAQPRLRLVRQVLEDVVAPLPRPALPVDQHEVVLGGPLGVAVAGVDREECALGREHEAACVGVVVAC
jgi:hypothetical protein